MFTDVLTNSSANVCITAGDDGVAACATGAAAAVPASPIDAPASICMYVHTCYVLIKPPMPIHYVLAAVFASCFYVLKSLLHE